MYFKFNCLRWTKLLTARGFKHDHEKMQPCDILYLVSGSATNISTFDVLLIVNLSLFISVINQLNAQHFCFTISLFHVNVHKNPTRCNSMQLFIHCEVTLHVSGVTAPIIRSTKNCNRNLRYRSYCKIEGLTGMN